jgi:hypothetical protein
LAVSGTVNVTFGVLVLWDASIFALAGTNSSVAAAPTSAPATSSVFKLLGDAFAFDELFRLAM